MKTIPSFLLKTLPLYFSVLFLANCSSVQTLNTQLQKNELTGIIAVTKPSSYGPEHKPLKEQGGAFPVYFTSALAKQNKALSAVASRESLSTNASAQEISKLGKKAGADWVLQSVLLGDSANIRHSVEHYIDARPIYRGRRGRFHPASTFYFLPPDSQTEASTSAVRTASLSLRLYRVSDGAQVWLAEGTKSVSQTNTNNSWGWSIRLPAAPPTPDLAKALAALAKDSAKELKQYAPKRP